ncbi:hypothetical protein D3C85_1355180 [compost metagenome]
MWEAVVRSFSSLVIRPEFKGGDTLFLLLSIIVGSAFGYLMGDKISIVVGLVFGFFSTAVLYYMWRTPA